MRVLIHNPDELPSDSAQQFLFSKNYETFVFIEPQVTYTDDNLKSMSLKKRGCYLPGEKSLQYFKVYTKTNCEQECLSEMLMKTCGCAPFYMISKKQILLVEFLTFNSI
jgi:acid-sensing ion channel, other